MVLSQDVSIYPTGSSSVDRSMAAVQLFHRQLLAKIGEKNMVQTVSDCGCVRVSLSAVDDAVKVL